jgi:hypothetical protein
MEMKIKVTLSDGSRRVLKDPNTLESIDENREAGFVMVNGQVFYGFCDGDVDEDGDFCIMQTHGIGLPFKSLIGWFYKSSGRKKSIKRK